MHVEKAKEMTEIVGPDGAAIGQVRSDSLAPREREQAERRTRAILKNMSPKGLLGLPKLLEERRWEFGITDGAFQRQAAFARVFLWQIPMQSGDTYNPESKIVMAESTKQREKNKAPYGIVISAGLLALDSLRSNGIDLGHKVLFAHTAPYHIRYDVIDGLEQHLVILNAGDIIGSEDLATNLKKRDVRFKQGLNANGAIEHTFQDDTGKTWLPQEGAWREDE